MKNPSSYNQPIILMAEFADAAIPVNSGIISEGSAGRRSFAQPIIPFGNFVDRANPNAPYRDNSPAS